MKIPNRIIVMGGSTVYGQGDPQFGGFVSHLRNWHETSAPQVNRVFNLGIGGDAVGDMLKRAELECHARRPDLIILYPGLNDTRRSQLNSTMQTEPDSFKSTLRKLIATLQSISPLIVMSSVAPDEIRTSPFRGKWFFKLDDARKFSEIVRDTSAEMRIPYIEIFEEFSRMPKLNDLLFDGLHCNPEGHTILYKKVRFFLEELYSNKVSEVLEYT